MGTRTSSPVRSARRRRAVITSVVLAVTCSGVVAGPATAAWYRSEAPMGTAAAGDVVGAYSFAELPNGELVIGDTLQSRMLHTTATGVPIKDLSPGEDERFARLGQFDTEVASDGNLLLTSLFAGGFSKVDMAGNTIWHVSGPPMTTSILEAPGDSYYVASWGTQWIGRYDSAGNLLGTFIPAGTDPGEVEQVTDMARSPLDGSIWLTETGGGGEVKHFAADGTFIGEYPQNGAWGIDVAADGSVYVTSVATAEVRHFDTDGTDLGMLGGAFGMGPDERIWPTDVVVSQDGSILVADGARGRITRFAPDGTVLGAIGAPAPRVDSLRTPNGVIEGPDGSVWAVDMEQDGLRRIGADGAVDLSVVGSFGGPTMLAAFQKRMITRDNGTLWIGDAASGTIRELGPGNTLSAGIGSVGTNPGEFQDLASFAVAVDGTLFTVELGGRVQHLAADGTPIADWGGMGSTDGLFQNPTSIDTDPDGNVWVLDYADARLQQFAPDGTHLRTLHLPPFAVLPLTPVPPSIEISPDGTHVLVTEPWSHRVVERRTSDGSLVSTIERESVMGGRIILPADASYTTDGDVLVAETFASRVTRWSRDDVAPAAAVAAAASTGTVTFTATGSDSRSGLAPTAYSWDGGTTWVASPTLTVSGRGASELVARTVTVRDRAGNTATASTSATTPAAVVTPTVVTPTAAVDTTPPVLGKTPGPIVSGVIGGGSGPIRFPATDPESGVITYVVTFRGERIVLTGNVLDPARLPEGRGTLRIELINGAGLRSSVSYPLNVDRTAPKLRHATSAYAFGTSLVLPVDDAGRARSIRLAGLRPGVNVRSLRLGDAAGNVRRVTVRVERRLSLATPALNRGIRLTYGATHSQATYDTVFGFDLPTSPWYRGTGVAPELVVELQRRLQDWGYMPRALKRTGRLDIETIKAVKRFQRDEGIPAIATVGARTRAALDARLLGSRRPG